MRRVLLTMIVAVLAAAQASAQNPLNIDKVFDGDLAKSKNAIEILVTGERANRIELTTYHSLAVENEPSAAAIIERAVAADGAKALDKEVEYRGNHIYFGFYTLPTIKVNDKPMCRYIMYLNQNLASKKPTDKVTLVYIESHRDAHYVKSLIAKNK